MIPIPATGPSPALMQLFNINRARYVEESLNIHLPHRRFTVWRGPLNGSGIETKEEVQDPHSCLLRQVNFDQPNLLRNFDKKTQMSIGNALTVLQDCILPDAQVGFSLLESGSLTLTKLFGKKKSVIIGGTTLRDSSGIPYVLSLEQELPSIWSLIPVQMSGPIDETVWFLTLGPRPVAK